MRYADCGANIVGMTILTSGDTIKKNPDLVKRFVRATAKSWEEAKKNPGAAVDAAMKAKPDLNRQSTLDQLMVDIDLLDSKNSEGPHRLGRAGRLGPDARDPQELSRPRRPTRPGRRSTPTSSCRSRLAMTAQVADAAVARRRRAPDAARPYVEIAGVGKTYRRGGAKRTRSSASTSRSAPASSWRSSGRRAAARARCCASSPGCISPSAGEVRVAGRVVDRPADRSRHRVPEPGAARLAHGARQRAACRSSCAASIRARTASAR